MLIAFLVLLARAFLGLEVDYVNTGLMYDLGIGNWGYLFCETSCELPLSINPCIFCDSDHVLGFRAIGLAAWMDGTIRGDISLMLPALRVLDLHGNDVSPGLPPLPAPLEELDLRFNKRMSGLASLPLGLKTLRIEGANFSTIAEALPLPATLEWCTLVDTALNETAGGTPAANCFVDLCDRLPSLPAACVASHTGTSFEPCTPAFYARCPHLVAPTTTTTASSPSSSSSPPPPPPPPPLIAGQTMFTASLSADTIDESAATLTLVLLLGGALVLLVAALLLAVVGVACRRRTRNRHRRQRRSTTTTSSHSASRPASSTYSGSASRPVSEAVARVSYQAMPRRSRAISRARRDTTSGYDKAPSLSKLDRGYYDMPPATSVAHTYDHAPSVASECAGVRAYEEAPSMASLP